MMLEAVQRAKRVLFLAHRRELITQAAERLTQFGLVAGVVMSGTVDFSRHVTVASVSTLVNYLEHPDLGAFDLVIADEAHHFVLGKAAEASEFESEAEAVKLGMYHRIFDRLCKDTYLLGLTATAVRLDGKMLGDVFETLVIPEVDGVQVDTLWLQEQGFLVPARYYAARKLPDLTDLTVGANSGDYNAGKLFERYDTKELYADVIEHWQQRAKGMSTVCFNVNRKHSLHMTAEFLAAGITCEHVDGKTPTAERDAIFARFKRRETLVLCNVGIVSEGLDIPGIECVIFNRATESVAFWVQGIGRALRPVYCPGMPLTEAVDRLCAIVWSDKPDAVILDHGGNFMRLGPAEMKREYTLTGKRKKKGKPPVLECPEAYGGCGRLLFGRPVTCPDCGLELLEYLPPEEIPEGAVSVKGELVEVTPEMLKRVPDDASFAQIEAIRKEGKRSIGWVGHQLRYKAKIDFLKRRNAGETGLDEGAIFAALLTDYGQFMEYKPAFVSRTLEAHGFTLYA
jgi:DNA repair protein RadD